MPTAARFIIFRDIAVVLDEAGWRGIGVRM